MERLETRVRGWTVFFIVGLVLSGVTALPIPTAVEMGSAALGPELDAGGRLPGFVAAWLSTLRDGIRLTAARAPFMFYGTDWLAFGHFMIDASFGVIGFVPVWLCHRWTGVLEQAGPQVIPEATVPGDG